MLTLVYGPNGADVNDFNYKEWISELVAQDWANEDITIHVSSRLPVLLVQIAIVKEEILHDFVEFTSVSEQESYWKPTKFNRYGIALQGMYVFNNDITKLNRKFLYLRAAQEARDAEIDPNQENLF